MTRETSAAAVIAEPVSTIEKPNPLSSRRILVVEDEPEILAAYQEILQPQAKMRTLKSSRSKTNEAAPTSSDHFDVVAVATGERAVEEVRKAMKEKTPFTM